MNLPYPFKSARGLEPDALGRIALVDGCGKVLTHLPLATAHELTAPPVAYSRVGDAYIVHDGGYGSGDYDNSDGWGYGSGDYCYCDGSGKGNGYGDSYGSGYSDGQGDGDDDVDGYSHG